jgi:hypothetical protein
VGPQSALSRRRCYGVSTPLFLLLRVVYHYCHLRSLWLFFMTGKCLNIYRQPLERITAHLRRCFDASTGANHSRISQTRSRKAKRQATS